MNVLPAIALMSAAFMMAATANSQAASQSHASRYRDAQISSAITASTVIRRADDLLGGDTRIVRAFTSDRPAYSRGSAVTEVKGVRVFRGGAESGTRPCTFRSEETGVTTYTSCLTRTGETSSVMMRPDTYELAGGPTRRVSGPAFFSASHQPSVNHSEYKFGLRPKVVLGPLRRY
ncbi:hypothetical protein WNY37_18135 [Henriciella sp. AS95]|uniref:hypothetical protein n=1 Tax=Henriciella sp. AS95 TaxID=3135782 RepID=UPI003176BF56